jgi:alpha-L-rhamnosidase
MRKIIFLLLALLSGAVCFAQVKVEHLLTEDEVDPICIDTAIPRFSWKLDAGDQRNIMQTAYEIKATSYTYLKKGKRDIWSSGKVMSDQSVYVPYNGETLASGEKCYWQVRVWDNTGKASEWSVPASWQMGLLSPADWQAKWITPGFQEDSVNRPSPLFRKTFSMS